MAERNDGATTLQEVKDQIAQFTAARDWQPFHTPKNLAMALASEAAELMAHFRWSQDGGESTLVDPKSRQEIRYEVADVFVLLAEFANITHIDIAEAVAEKMAINEVRYSVEKSRGTAAKYDRL